MKMPPPKIKLHKPEKLKIVKKSEQSDGNNAQPSSSNQLNGESDQQFECELAWCIQNLETSLNGGKLNAKQAEDTIKTVKLLKSSSQPLIRKRQIMRSAFGDYRAKMAEEEKKLRIGRRQIKFSSTANTKSFFVKRSALLTLGKDKDFKFDFSASAEIPMEQLHLSDESKETDQPAKLSNVISYAPGDNSFRFNFDIAETQ